MRSIILGLLLASSMAINAQFVKTSRVNFLSHDEWVTQIVVTPSGKEIIYAGVDGRVIVWEVASGKKLREISLPSCVLSLSLSKSGSTIAAGDSSGVVSLIDTQSGKINTSFRADKNLVNATAWSNDDASVAAGGADGIVRIASAKDGKIVREIKPAHGDVTDVAFAKDQLLIGFRDRKQPKKSAELWDWQKNKLLRSFDEGPAGIRGISISPDGQWAAIADYQEPTLLTMAPTEGGAAEVSLRILPDNDDGTFVAIWDLASGKRIALIKGETGARSIAFSPDGQLLATAGPNGVIIHDIGKQTFTELGRIDSLTGIDDVTFTPDSKQLVIAREREPMVRFGEGGTDKLIDPFFTSIVMQVRQGLNSGVMAKFGAAAQPGQMTTKISTGGSTIELWQVDRRASPADMQSWEAVLAVFGNKPEEARRILQKVILDFPAYGEAQRLLAVLLESNDIKKVQSLLEAAVKVDSGCVACWRSLGDVQSNTKQYMAALKSYDQALQLRPEYGLVAGHQANTYGALALSLMSSENTEKAMDAAKQALNSALKLRPGVEEFYTNLAAAYYFRGDFDTDINLLLVAKRLRPDHARIYYNLGHAYRQKGDKQKAVEAYQRYVMMGEEGEEARVERAKDFIKELTK